MIGLLRFDGNFGQSRVCDWSHDPEVDISTPCSAFTADIEVSSGAVRCQERRDVAGDLWLVERAAGIAVLAPNEAFPTEPSDILFAEV